MKNTLKRLTAGILLAAMGLMLTPVAQAVVFTNAEGDEYNIQNSRVESAKYSGGIDPCNGTFWKCMTTWDGVGILTNTVVFQDAENIHFGIQTRNNIQYSHKFFVPSDGKFIRKLVKLHNATGSTRTISPLFIDHLLRPVRDTSTGDAIATVADTWAVLEGDGARPFYVAHWGINAVSMSPTFFWVRFNGLSIPAGETRYLLFYTAVENNLSEASATAESISAGSAFRQFEGLSLDELDNSINLDQTTLVIKLSSSDLIAEQGSTVDHTLTVTNDDAVPINFAVTVNNNPRWNTVPSVSNIFVPAGESRTFDVSVTIPTFAALLGNNEDLAVIQIDGGGFTRRANVVTQTVLAQLTETPFNNPSLNSRLSKNGQLVVFSADEDLTGGNADRSDEVFSISADGTGLTQLTSGLFRDSIIEGVNADGSQILFTENFDDLYVMDADGNNRVLLSTRSQQGHASISADTNKVVYVSTNDELGDGSNADGSWEIFSINSDGSGRMQLTDDSNDVFEFIGDTSISDDGSAIAFESSYDLLGTNVQNDLVIYSMDASGNNIFQLTEDDINIQDLTISGNGGYVVYASRESGIFLDNHDESFEIFRVSVDGQNPIQLTASNRDSRFPSLSYDGNRVLFSSRGDLLGNGSNINTFDIFIIDIANEGLLQLTRSNRNSETSGQNINASGDRVAFTSFANLTGDNPDLGEELFIASLVGRPFNNTLFTQGISILLQFGFPDDLVQGIIDDQLNGVDDENDQQQDFLVIATKDGGILSFDAWLLFMLGGLLLVSRKWIKSPTGIVKK